MTQGSSVESAVTRPAPSTALTRWVIALLLLVSGGWLTWHLTRAQRDARGAAAVAPPANEPRPVSVVVAEAVERDVPIFLHGLGNAVPLNSVTVRSQVEGRIEKLSFVEGQPVKAGDVLAQIDARPFDIQVRQAEAALARDAAAFNNARTALARLQALRKEGLATQQQLDDQQALANQLEAGLRGDRVSVDSARLQLDYTHIRSPIDGVSGVRLLDPGNLVRANDPTGIVVVTQLDPMGVVFTLPQDDVASVQSALAGSTLGVEVMSRDGTRQLSAGKLAVIDNQVDSATATVKLKAIVSNRERSLWPNQFVQVRLTLGTRPHALVVPAAAVQRAPEGAIVYVVEPNQSAAPRRVEVVQVEGPIAILSSGVTVGERVVVEGHVQLRPGSKVLIRGQ